MVTSCGIEVKALILKDGAQIPSRATAGAAGFDVRAHLDEPLTLKPLERCAVPTGIALEIPLGYEGQIRARSGLARNYGITLLNSPGTIDSDYRGEIAVLLINLGSESWMVKNGDRIAQIVFAKMENIFIKEESALNKTERAEKGFGSTGYE